MQDSNQTDRQGINLTEQRVLDLGLIFREQPISDFGIDAQFELKVAGKSTGRLIAAQVKAGTSQFDKETEDGFWHYLSDRHRDLWINHSLPVVIVLCDLETRNCYYELVTPETCIRAGQQWKILVPKEKTLNASNLQNLVDIASPVAAASDFTIASEHDQSHAHAKRLSLDIVLHPGNKAVTKPFLGAIVRASLKLGQASSYSRDEISATALGDKPVDVVWGYVYLRDIDRVLAAWTCRFQWISPELEETWRPSVFQGEPSGDGLVIDWDGRAEISKLMDDNRTTKSAYLKQVDVLLGNLPAVQKELGDLIELGDQSPYAQSFSSRTEAFETQWEGSSLPPLECQRLDQALQEILATVGNSGLIWSQRGSRELRQVMAMMRTYSKDLERLNGEVSFLRRDVR